MRLRRRYLDSPSRLTHGNLGCRLRAKPHQAGGVLLSCLSSSGCERSRHAVEHALAEHRVQYVDSAPSEAEDGLIVALTLRALTVVVGARGRVPQAGVVLTRFGGRFC
jgi:hypothetical protein